MGTIIRLLRRIRFRLAVRKFLNILFLALFYTLLANLVILILDRVFYIGLIVAYLPLMVVISTFLFSLGYVIIKTPSLFESALEADKCMGLKERLSSAYLLREKDTPAAEALKSDALEHSKTVVPSKVVTLGLPRIAYLSFFLLIALIVCNGYMPYFDVMKRKQRIEEQKKEQQRTRELAEEIKRLSDSIKKKIKEARDEKKTETLKDVTVDLDRLARELELSKITRKEAAVKLSNVLDKVSERQNAVKTGMKSLSELSRNISQKFTRNLAKALANADTKTAQAELKKLANLLQSGNLSEAELQKLKQELEQLAKAAEKLSPELAKKLIKVAKCLEGKDLAKAASELDLTEEDLLELADGLSQLAMLSNVAIDLEARKRAMLCKTCALGGPCSCYSRDLIGPGMRGGGIGKGGDAKFDDSTGVNFIDTKIAGQKDKGKIISEIFFKGQPLPAEASEEFKNIYIESRQDAEDSLAKEVIPAGYKKFVMDYFDAINPEKINNTR